MDNGSTGSDSKKIFHSNKMTRSSLQVNSENCLLFSLKCVHTMHLIVNLKIARDPWESLHEIMTTPPAS